MPSAGAPRHGIIGGQAIAPGQAPLTRIALLLLAAALLVPAAPIAAAGDAIEEANKKAVVEFYDAGAQRARTSRRRRSTSARATSSTTRSPPDGAEGCKGFIGFLRDKFPQSRSEIKRVFAEGDYVILHVHSVREPGTRGRAIVDIFRLENGKIVEHWDVVQDDAGEGGQQPTACSSGGMF